MNEKKELKALQMHVAKRVAARIKAEREARGMTIYKFAKITGMSSAHIARIESGVIAPRIDVIERICIALNVTITLPIA